jgi:hypothetical protein
MADIKLAQTMCAQCKLVWKNSEAVHQSKDWIVSQHRVIQMSKEAVYGRCGRGRKESRAPYSGTTSRKGNLNPTQPNLPTWGQGAAYSHAPLRRGFSFPGLEKLNPPKVAPGRVLPTAAGIGLRLTIPF